MCTGSLVGTLWKINHSLGIFKDAPGVAIFIDAISLITTERLLSLPHGMFKDFIDLSILKDAQ